MGAEVDRAFVVHGEEVQSESLALGLRDMGAGSVLVPTPGQTVSISKS